MTKWRVGGFAHFPPLLSDSIIMTSVGCSKLGETL